MYGSRTFREKYIQLRRKLKVETQEKQVILKVGGTEDNQLISHQTNKTTHVVSNICESNHLRLFSEGVRTYIMIARPFSALSFGHLSGMRPQSIASFHNINSPYSNTSEPTPPGNSLSSQTKENNIDERLIHIVENLNKIGGDQISKKKWNQWEESIWQVLLYDRSFNNLQYIVKKLNYFSMRQIDEYGNIPLAYIALQDCLDYMQNISDLSNESILSLKSLTLNNRGCLLRRMGEFSTSLECFEEALTILNQISCKQYLGLTYLNMSILLSALGNHYLSLENAQCALNQQQKLLFGIKTNKQSNKITVDKSLHGPFTIGNLRTTENNSHKQISKLTPFSCTLDLNYSLDYLEQIADKESEDEFILGINTLALSHFNIATEMEYLGQREDALFHFQKSYQYAQKYLGNTNRITLQCFEELKLFQSRFTRLKAEQNIQTCDKQLGIHSHILEDVNTYHSNLVPLKMHRSRKNNSIVIARNRSVQFDSQNSINIPKNSNHPVLNRQQSDNVFSKICRRFSNQPKTSKQISQVNNNIKMLLFPNLKIVEEQAQIPFLHSSQQNGVFSSKISSNNNSLPSQLYKKHSEQIEKMKKQTIQIDQNIQNNNNQQNQIINSLKSPMIERIPHLTPQNKSPPSACFQFTHLDLLKEKFRETSKLSKISPLYAASPQKAKKRISSEINSQFMYQNLPYQENQRSDQLKYLENIDELDNIKPIFISEPKQNDNQNQTNVIPHKTYISSRISPITLKSSKKNQSPNQNDYNINPITKSEINILCALKLRPIFNSSLDYCPTNQIPISPPPEQNDNLPSTLLKHLFPIIQESGQQEQKIGQQLDYNLFNGGNQKSNPIKFLDNYHNLIMYPPDNQTQLQDYIFQQNEQNSVQYIHKQSKDLFKQDLQYQLCQNQQQPEQNYKIINIKNSQQSSPSQNSQSYENNIASNTQIISRHEKDIRQINNISESEEETQHEKNSFSSDLGNINKQKHSSKSIFNQASIPSSKIENNFRNQKICSDALELFSSNEDGANDCVEIDFLRQKKQKQIQIKTQLQNNDEFLPPDISNNTHKQIIKSNICEIVPPNQENTNQSNLYQIQYLETLVDGSGNKKSDEESLKDIKSGLIQNNQINISPIMDEKYLVSKQNVGFSENCNLDIVRFEQQQEKSSEIDEQCAQNMTIQQNENRKQSLPLIIISKVSSSSEIEEKDERGEQAEEEVEEEEEEEEEDNERNDIQNTKQEGMVKNTSLEINQIIETESSIENNTQSDDKEEDYFDQDYNINEKNNDEIKPKEMYLDQFEQIVTPPLNHPFSPRFDRNNEENNYSQVSLSPKLLLQQKKDMYKEDPWMQGSNQFKTRAAQSIKAMSKRQSLDSHINLEFYMNRRARAENIVSPSVGLISIPISRRRFKADSLKIFQDEVQSLTPKIKERRESMLSGDLQSFQSQIEIIQAGTTAQLNDNQARTTVQKTFNQPIQKTPFVCQQIKTSQLHSQ